MRNPIDDRWTLERLDELGPHEYDFQEFKSTPFLWDGKEICSSFHHDLSKQLSAFANGAGGRIFLGVDDRGDPDEGIPKDLKPGGTRSWLEDVIPRLVSPPLARFNVHEVPGVDGGKFRTLPGRAVYVVDVPSSEEAPHQALDNRYYLRIAGKSRPMGHVHVQDILRRTRQPHVEVSRLGPYGVAERILTDPRGPKVYIAFRLFVANRGRTMAHHVGTEILLPRPLVGREVRQRMLESGEIQYTQTPGTIVMFRYHPTPLFPGQEIFSQLVWVGIHRSNIDVVRSGEAALSWKVFADDAAARMGRQSLRRYQVVERALNWLQRQKE
jgi:hypothetical protein